MFAREVFALFVAVCAGPYCGPDSKYESPAGSSPESIAAPAVAVAADGTCYLVWEAHAAGSSHAWFGRRGPGPGGSWAEPFALDEGGTAAIEVRVAAGADRRVAVVWQARDPRDGELRFRASPDGGATWSPEARLPAAGGDARRSMAQIASAPDGTWYAAWEEIAGGERGVRFARSLDGGSGFHPSLRLDAGEPGGASYHPQISALDSGTVLVAWWEERDGRTELLFRRSTDAGESWGAEGRFAGSSGTDVVARRDARLAARDRTTAIAWEETDSVGSVRVFAARSTDAGETWSEPWTCGTGVYAAVAVGVEDWAVAWTVRNPAPPGRTSIAGRIVDLPETRTFRVALPARGVESPLFELSPPAHLALASARGGLWVVGSGQAAGRTVVEAHGFRDGRWNRGAVLSFGGNGPRDYVPWEARSLVAAATEDGGVHVAWISDSGGRGELAYVRLETATAAGTAARP